MDKIAIIGLGYVGLPLAVEFGKRYETIRIDNNDSYMQELNRGYDGTLEDVYNLWVDSNEPKKYSNL